MSTSRADIWIALGSNLGDRVGTLRAALVALDAHPSIEVVTASAPWETEPQGVLDQPRFVNAVAGLRSGLSPRALLEALLEVERSLGRTRTPDGRWGPRTIDLDLLLYGQLVVRHDDTLEVPHPRMLVRSFVMAPLGEVAAEVVHPEAGRTIGALVASWPTTWSDVRRLDAVSLWPATGGERFADDAIDTHCTGSRG